MKHFINNINEEYWVFEDDVEDIFKFPNTPKTLIPCEPKPDFGIWVNDNWVIDEEARSKSLLYKILAAIDSKKNAEIKNLSFDNEAQVFRYAQNNPTKWNSFAIWIDSVNYFWDEVKEGTRIYNTLEEAIGDIPILNI